MSASARGASRQASTCCLEVVRMWRMPAKCGPDSAKLSPNLGRLWPTLTQTRCWPNLDDLGPHFIGHGVFRPNYRNWAAFGPDRANVVDAGPNVAASGPSFVDVMAPLWMGFKGAGCRPTSIRAVNDSSGERAISHRIRHRRRRHCKRARACLSTPSACFRAVSEIGRCFTRCPPILDSVWKLVLRRAGAPARAA